ncbi:MAG: alpha-amylase family glycosyl hydrolase [Bacteroidota bacterium]
MKTLLTIGLLLVIISLIFVACRPGAKTTSAEAVAEFEKPRVPDWHKNATIYEVNMRHFTPEGTFASFEAHIPRLKEMGIDILWFMPINPISVKNRKGELGSPYAVADYRGVNPDYGTMEEFKHMLQAIHEAGMYCIIDWVPNHTGWDNPWITEHPEWYTQDKDGNIIDPIDYNTGESWGWTDVADLNYDVPEMRQAMIEAMAFWIAEVGIDGFRVDVAHGVPVDFWEECSDALYAIEPVFMLAEAEVPALRNTGSYVADYGWEMHHLLNEIAKSQGANREAGQTLVKGNLVEGEGADMEKKTALDIDKMLAKKAADYSQGYFMQFTSNHDENSWSGTEFARMGDGHKAFAVLTATFDGMPLVYTGQESAMDKQLEFFVKDEIPWGDYAYAGFYQTLFDLKHRNQALWNGKHGGELVKIATGQDEAIYAFTREKNGDRVVVVINLSATAQEFALEGEGFAGNYLDIFSSETTELSLGMAMSLGAWEYRVLEME